MVKSEYHWEVLKEAATQSGSHLGKGASHLEFSMDSAELSRGSRGVIGKLEKLVGDFLF